MKIHKNQEYETPLIEDLIQAHDVLTAFLREMEKLPIEHQPDTQFMAVIYGHRDVLCWILGHKGNAFEINTGSVLEILETLRKDNLN